MPHGRARRSCRRALACLVGYFGYETIGLVETLPRPPPIPLGLPDMLFVRPTLILVFDRLADALFLVAPVWPDAARSRRARSPRRTSGSTRPPRGSPAPLPAAARGADAARARAARRCCRPAAIGAMVLTAKDYIVAGDIFQVVLAQRFTAPFPLPPFELYRALRRINPSPFLYHPRPARLRADRLEPRDPRARARRRGDDPPDRRHPPARQDRGRGRGQPRQPARRSQGARRASDAARSRPQRCRPRRRSRAASRSPTATRSSSTATSCTSSRTSSAGSIAATGRARRAVRRLPRRHRQRRAQGPRLRDHRRARARDARRLCRRRRLFLARRIDGPLHRAAHRGGEGRRRCTSRPAPASSPTATPPTNSANARPRPARCSPPRARRSRAASEAGFGQ